MLARPDGSRACPQPPPLLDTVIVQVDDTYAWVRIPLVSQTFASGTPLFAAALTPSESPDWDPAPAPRLETRAGDLYKPAIATPQERRTVSSRTVSHSVRWDRFPAWYDVGQHGHTIAREPAVATKTGFLDIAAAAMTERPILVVKLGALGNVILSLNAFAAIRAFHRSARISLLTTAPYADWLRTAPWFDEVLVDSRPAWWNLSAVGRLRRMLTSPGFARVYDLQTSSRSSHYFRLFPANAKPEWSGIAPGCSHPDRDPARDRLHDNDRQAGQLRQAGLSIIPLADLSWCTGDLGRFGLPRDFAAFVPGSAPHRPAKRWPTARYQALALALRAEGLTPVVLGGAGETDLAKDIPAAIDLTGQTSFGDLAEIGRAARFAVGNDTGPMHLLATAGCPSVVLFSRDSDPVLCAPRGPDVLVLRRPDLASLEIGAVLDILPHLVTA